MNKPLTHLNWTPTDDEPWTHESKPAMSQREYDRILSEADKTAYNAEYGHVERRHAEISFLHHGLKILAAIIGGLIMALGFHPIIVFIITVAIWRSLEEIVEVQEQTDKERRAFHGVD